MNATLRLALLLLIGAAHADEPCGPAPPAPQSEAWAVQISELRWRTEVPGWVAAPAPACWVLGRVELVYELDDPYAPANNGTEVLTQDPGPWVEGDFDAAESCPVEALAGCWAVVDFKKLVRLP